MSIKQGKTELSFRKKKGAVAQSNTATISKDVLFADQRAGGETSINLNSLTTPTTMSGFNNPTLTELLSANIKKNANNLIVISSHKGALQIKADFTIPTNDKINLNFAAQANEVFTFQLRATEAISEVISGSPYVSTGTLIAGQTDIPLGQAFELNANSSEQIGQFTVKIDGVQMFRNLNNVTAAPAAEGNYEEVSGGGAGLTNLIRFNVAFPQNVSYSIESLGPILDTNNTGLIQRIEAVEGQLDQVIPTVANLADVPETDFQAGPSNIDLKAFANKLYQACLDIATNTASIALNALGIANHESRVTALENKIAFSAYLTANQNTNTGIIIWGAKQWDYGNNYNTSTGEFTAPESGLYYFNLIITSSIAQTSNFISLNKNGVRVRDMLEANTFDVNTEIHAGAILNLIAGDKINVVGSGNFLIEGNTGGNGAYYSLFQGYKI